MSVVSFNHTLLGSFLGVQATPLVTQFRSIPYATYPERFRQSSVKTSYGQDERNFTEYGYVCPQVEELDDSPSGGPVPGAIPFKADEHKCLVVTITVPNAALEQTKSKSNAAYGKQGLPVMFYIHGGGFVEGSALGGEADQKHNVDLSITDKQSVISVTIQYRLNWFGFIGSQDLLDEAKANNEAPLNYGLFDQRNALRWVQKYIAGFGGDPDNVTLYGESAGAMSVYFHMLGGEKLFKRAIPMSGGAEPNIPSPIPPKQRAYDRLLGALNISSTSASDRLAALRAAPMSALVAAVPAGGFSWGAYNDSSFFPTPVTYNNAATLVANVPWIKELMVGTCGFEGYVWKDFAKAVNPTLIYGVFNQIIGQESTAKVLGAYNITIGMDENKFWTKSMEFFGDYFLAESDHHLSIVASSKKPLYRYYFDMRNPFPGSPQYQVAHHWVDMYYAFQTLNFRFPTQRDIDVSTKFARYLISFANGKAPWARFETNGDQKLQVANWYEGWTTRTRKLDEKITERRYQQMELIREAFGAVGDTWIDIAKILGS